jgi:GTPase SAR1 family protein
VTLNKLFEQQIRDVKQKILDRLQNVFLQQIRDVEQQIHRQLGDGYDSIVNYACGNKTKFLCSDY